MDITENAPTHAAAKNRLWTALTWTVGLAISTLGIGEFAISLGWLMTDKPDVWRERTTVHALWVGLTVEIVVLAVASLTRSHRPWMRTVAIASAGIGFVLVALPRIPQQLGGLRPECAIAHLDASSFSPAVLEELSDGSATLQVKLLFTDAHFHHFTRADGRYIAVNRSRVAALETCPW